MKSVALSNHTQEKLQKRELDNFSHLLKRLHVLSNKPSFN